MNRLVIADACSTCGGSIFHESAKVIVKYSADAESVGNDFLVSSHQSVFCSQRCFVDWIDKNLDKWRDTAP
jgi:hypothetical protein